MRSVFLTLMFLAAMTGQSLAREIISEDLARHIALEKEPGDVRQTVIRKGGQFLIYDFDVAKEDGKIMRVTVDGFTGAILTIAPVDIPETPQLLEGDAKAIAIKHVQGEDMTIQKPEVLSAEYTTFTEIPAYLVKLKLNFIEHDIYIDANSGKILSSQIIEK
jgi:uncharacterized membrane protein YkoI